MRKRFFVLFAVLLIGLAFPVTAIAGSVTLHPAGFGENSRANWKAQQGLPDSTPTGNPNQALYFQKMTATATFAAGVAVIRGFEGQSADVITGLQWYHRVDGHEAPRVDLRRVKKRRRWWSPPLLPSGRSQGSPGNPGDPVNAGSATSTSG